MGYLSSACCHSRIRQKSVPIRTTSGDPGAHLLLKEIHVKEWLLRCRSGSEITASRREMDELARRLTEAGSPRRYAIEPVLSGDGQAFTRWGRSPPEVSRRYDARVWAWWGMETMTTFSAAASQ